MYKTPNGCSILYIFVNFSKKFSKILLNEQKIKENRTKTVSFQLEINMKSPSFKEIIYEKMITESRIINCPFYQIWTIL